MGCWLLGKIHKAKETGDSPRKEREAYEALCSYLLRRRKRQNHCRRRLAARMAGYGKRCCSFSFLRAAKPGRSIVLRPAQFQILRSEKPFPFTFQMDEAQKQELREIHNGLLRQALEQCRREAFGLAVLDEAFAALQENLLDEALLQKFLSELRGRMEIVLTGRTPPKAYLDLADYVTEMTLRKHPYGQGLEARRGVEY